jgi:hypothetical protein
MAERRAYRRSLRQEICKIENNFRVVEQLSACSNNIVSNPPDTDARANGTLTRNIVNYLISDSDSITENADSRNTSSSEEGQAESESECIGISCSAISSSESDSERSVDSAVVFSKEFLAKWAVENAIPHNALNLLLKGLQGHHCFKDYPHDSRTLLKTPQRTLVREVLPGQYTHFGLQNRLRNIDRLLDLSNDNILKLQFNMDGLPLYKSSKVEFWPILGYICSSLRPPFLVGLYVGEGKPTSVNSFLEDFISELQFLISNGFIYNGIKLNIEVDSFVCDAPARAFISCIKGHTGYYGCGKCNVVGKYVHNRVVYLDLCAPLRTDFQFRHEKDQFEDHHNGVSPLEELDIDMVNSIPYEYMHLVCLGVVRKMLQLWLRGKKKDYRLSAHQSEVISASLLNMKSYVPSEFARKPRSLREIDRWKATELRQFLLYTGPLVLKGVLNEEHYSIFMCLHVAIRILVSEHLHKNIMPMLTHF